MVPEETDYLTRKMNIYWDCKIYHIFYIHSPKVKVTQSCPTLCDPTNYTVHGILQAGILERVAFPFSRGPSQPRDRTQVSCIVGEFFTSWATREGKTHQILKYFCKNDSVWFAVKIEGEIKDIKWCYHLNLFNKLSPSLPLIDTSSIHLIKESTHNLTTIIT